MDESVVVENINEQFLYLEERADIHAYRAVKPFWKMRCIIEAWDEIKSAKCLVLLTQVYDEGIYGGCYSFRY